MSLETIIEIVSYAVLAVGSVVIQIINFCRTGKVPEKVASRLAQAPAPSSAEQLEVSMPESASSPSVSSPSATASHSHEVTIDNDYDIVFMSRSLYQYFLECEKKTMEVSANVGVPGHND